jgi:hypothetical protein
MRAEKKTKLKHLVGSYKIFASTTNVPITDNLTKMAQPLYKKS